nr:EGF and EGF calcium-binding and Notch region and Notch and Ankyrin domain containing protein [Haemonchus contortus]
MYMALLVEAKFLPGPCNQQSCLNGGTCYPGVNSTHWCRCLPTYRGDRCDQSMCGKECQNEGICISHDRNVTFSCQCPLGFTGVHCEQALDSICRRQSRCGDHGKCVLTGSLEQYACRCDDGWIGDHCDKRDPCPPEYCNHGGKCTSNGTGFVCSCPLGFHGPQCEYDINECDSSPCAFGKCVNTMGSYRCECDEGFIGRDCQIYRTGLECSLTGPNICRNGGVCVADEINNNNACVCPPMYQGLFCEKDVDECLAANPCENGGTCVNLNGGFECACTAAFEGELCTINKDDCVNNKCSLGATCIDLIGSYRCECPEGRIGSLCQYNDPCHSKPCLNGRCIGDPETGESTCTCDHGYTGPYCDEDIDECAEWGEALCHNGATCVNIAGSYTCECPTGVTGQSCDTLMEMCHPNPCLNSGVCVDRLNNFECSCAEGFTGPTCAEKCSSGDRCSCSPGSCLNGGFCQNNTCKCSKGFTGKYCEIELNPCEMTKCPTGQICIENNGTRSVSCVCPVGYTGYDCLKEIDECSTNPCQHGGTCSDRLGDYFCLCPSGYSGKNCENIVDHCTTNPCLNNGVCINAAHAGICHCTPAFFGDRCQYKRNPCSRNRCDNRAICRPTANYRNYTCDCKPGFEGKYCELDINECKDEPCRNGGTCHNTHGDYNCICPVGYTGRNCVENIDDCARSPCLNNGTCVDDVANFHCVCQPGYTGRTCGVDIDDCADNPCLNGATCVDGVNCYECLCKRGFSGRDCHINDDDCRPGLCLNGGKCIDLVNNYKCDCPHSYTGRNCQIFVDLDKFSDTDRREQKYCELSDCQSKGGDGECHSECNYFACGFDAGDCSAKGEPFSKCDSASYCSHVFKDGHCDPICNNEACLFDGFDCAPGHRDCPSNIVDYCRMHGHDGICDEQCNSPECAFDGGDCSTKKLPSILPGDISIVVLTPPQEFVKNVGLFLMILSQKLRASIRIKSDKSGPLVFHWNGSPSTKRVIFDRKQELSISYGGAIRMKRANPDVGVLVWIEVDVADCYGECFSDVDIVANYLGAANAKKDLAEMGMPIYEAVARHKNFEDTTLSYSDTYWSFIIGCFAILIVVVTVFVLQQRTRKRRTIKAPCWIPPTEAQHKLSSLSQSEQMLRSSFFSDDLFPTKKPRIDNLSYYKVCEYAKPAKKIPARITTLHKQASSNVPIQVEASSVNVRGPFGRTALMMLCDNFEKPESQLIEEVDKIWAAGGDLNVQDDDEETAIFIAVRQGRLGLVKKLLDMGADPTIMNHNDSTCLHEAAANCNLSLVEELLRHNSVVKEIDVCDNNDRTPLMRCAANDTVDHQVAELLIRLGADPSYPGDKSALSYNGRTALHYAAQVNNVQMIEFLISRDANKDAQDLEDRTPLFLAASHGHLEAVQALVKAGASLEISDRKDRTPYKVAEENEFRHLLDLLDPEAKKANILLQIVANGKTTVKSSSRQVKRIPVKRRPQPLTPPHSDGCGSTPSPRAAFGAPSRPVASVLDSPSSDRTSNGNDGSSPGSLPLALHSYWASDVSHHSPPYETTELGICSYYNNYSIPNPAYVSQPVADIPYSSCQHSERSTYYSKQV